MNELTYTAPLTVIDESGTKVAWPKGEPVTAQTVRRYAHVEDATGRVFRSRGRGGRPVRGVRGHGPSTMKRSELVDALMAVAPEGEDPDVQVHMGDRSQHVVTKVTLGQNMDVPTYVVIRAR